MSMSDVMPWLNLLLIPVVGLLLSINARLAGLQATQQAHAIELAELRDVRERLARLEALRVWRQDPNPT